MSTILFVAQATADPAGGYRTTFPDLPDFEVKGYDLAEVLVNARQAVEAHLRRIADAGEGTVKANK